MAKRLRLTTIGLLLIPALIAAASTAQLAPHTWIGSDGAPLPFANNAEILEFLREAEIVSSEEISTGVTRPYRVLLRRGDIETHGVFRYVDERAAMASYPGERAELGFRDSAGFECAAYELSQLLNVRHVPPAVDRSYERKHGTLQLWVEGTMTERERLAAGRSDPAVQRWNRQLNVMNVFDVLIGNIDRNRGNILIDEYWRLWFIDHTRAFRGSSRLETDRLTSIEREFWEGLQTLDAAEVEERLGPYLTDREMKGLLQRAEKMVAHYRELIRTRGEDHVVYMY